MGDEGGPTVPCATVDWAVTTSPGVVRGSEGGSTGVFMRAHMVGKEVS